MIFVELVRIAPADGRAPVMVAADIERMACDEDRHAKIFEILAESLDEQDHMRAGVTAAGIAARIGEVGEFFLPRSLRSQATASNPLGSGGRVHVQQSGRDHGGSDEEKGTRFLAFLEELGLTERLAARARALGKPIGELRVAVKPAFMLGYHREDRSPVTDPTLVLVLARELRRLGVGDIAVVEARNLYDRFFQSRTVVKVGAYFGFGAPEYRLVDLSLEQVPHDFIRGMAQYTIGQTWRDADFRISFGKMQHHGDGAASLTLANIEGVGSRSDEYIFAER